MCIDLGFMAVRVEQSAMLLQNVFPACIFISERANSKILHRAVFNVI